MIDGVFLRYGVAAALVVGLMARVLLTSVLVPWGEIPIRWDDASYAKYALETLQLGRLDTHHFPVGYPLFVALCLKLGGGSFAAVRVANVIAGTLTIWLVAKVTTSCFGRAAGTISACLTAIYPPLVFMTSRVMSESIFIALLVASIYWLIQSTRDASVPKGILGGALFALASLFRSNLLVMLPFIPLWQLWPARRDWSRLSKRLSVGVSTVAVAGFILALPGLYFLQTKGEFIPLATNAGQTFYGANNPLADGGWVQVEDHPELLNSIPADVKKSPQAYSKAQNALAVQWIRNNPGRFVGLLPRKFANAWIPGFQKSVTTSSSRAAAVILPLAFGFVLVLAILGRIRTRPSAPDGVLLAIPVAYTVMSLLFYGNPRIGLFCAPVLIIYASACLSEWLKLDNSRGRASTSASQLGNVS